MTQNERVREVRKSYSLTLDKFGERIGLKKSAVSLIESGKNSLTDANIKSICREFNVSEEWLRNGTGDMEAIKPDDFTSAVVQIDKGDPKARQVILNYWHMSQQDKDLFWKFLDKLTNNKQDEEE